MIIAREKEIAKLRSCLESDRSEFIAVYGRRRIGKTFLIRESYNYSFTFQYAGIANASKEIQLSSFADALRDNGMFIEQNPKNWLQAFQFLKELIKKSTEKKRVVFLDELSWMWTPGCDLIAALESFWNGWASTRKDIVLITCASATSWMMKNIIHAYGGLHNRLSFAIGVAPFTLKECEEFSEAYNLALSRDQIIEAYMILGGVPYYWSLMDPHNSLPQNIDAMFFSPEALLKDEYKYLYASLFRNPEPYLRVIEILGTKKIGMTREEILAHLEQGSGGKLSDILEDLEHCGFVRSYHPFGRKKKGSLFQLMDCFTLFHFKYLAVPPTDIRFWSHFYNTPKANVWRGLAFERVCLWHVQQILGALGISGILTDICSWQCNGDEEKGIKGAQIDLVIDRQDKQVDLCEIKCCGEEFEVNKDMVESLRSKASSFKKNTGTRKGLRQTLITPVGLARNKYSGIFNSVITTDDLFS